MADGYVQVQVDGSGKKIDNAELTRDDGTVVERQRVVIGDDDSPRAHVAVGSEDGRGALVVGDPLLGVLQSIDHSLKMLVVMIGIELEADLDGVDEIVSLNDNE